MTNNELILELANKQSNNCARMWLTDYHKGQRGFTTIDFYTYSGEVGYQEARLAMRRTLTSLKKNNFLIVEVDGLNVTLKTERN